jgi:hypothetical protein
MAVRAEDDKVLKLLCPQQNLVIFLLCKYLTAFFGGFMDFFQILSFRWEGERDMFWNPCALDDEICFIFMVLIVLCF